MAMTTKLQDLRGLNMVGRRFREFYWTFDRILSFEYAQTSCLRECRVLGKVDGRPQKVAILNGTPGGNDTTDMPIKTAVLIRVDLAALEEASQCRHTLDFHCGGHFGNLIRQRSACFAQGRFWPPHIRAGVHD